MFLPLHTLPQAAFHVFGMELLTRLDLRATNQFFSTFFRLPGTYWRGFLASRLSSAQLLAFAALTWVLAPIAIKAALVTHLVSNPAGGYLIRKYLGALPDIPTAQSGIAWEPERLQVIKFLSSFRSSPCSSLCPDERAFKGSHEGAPLLSCCIACGVGNRRFPVDAHGRLACRQGRGHGQQPAADVAGGCSRRHPCCTFTRREDAAAMIIRTCEHQFLSER